MGPPLTGDSSAERYRSLSLWHDTVADDLTPRDPLPGDTEADVAVIGAGLTGLWTAWYLLDRDPSLRVVLLEKEIAGFGASGRNGGWVSALFPRSTRSLEQLHGREAALAMRRAMIATVDEVGAATRRAGIDCDFAKGGTVAFADSTAHRVAADAEVRDARSFGVDETHFDAVGGRVRTIDPNCARVHPAKLVRGLARAVEARGATVFEETEVLSWRAGSVRTSAGRVRARHVIRATEGYSAGIRQTHRDILPLYSLMIATEPLSDEVWDELGIAHGQTFTDHRHLIVYGQRTADNRIAFGGRGARYHWGSTIRPEFDRAERVFEHLRHALHDLLPQVGNPEITHRWGGPLGVPRDWHASVRYDARTGLGSAGGYVGDGLSTTNIAGRTLADLITGTPSDLTRLPWVGHRSPPWEAEPLRWIGANAGLVAMTVADAEERMTGRPSTTARLMAPLTGH